MQDLQAVENDFGHIITGRASGCLRPDSASELVTIITDARRTGRRLAIRGTGMSQSGQSLPDDGLVLDLSGWTQIYGLDEKRQSVTCQGGATWRHVLEQTLPLGLVPRVHPLNLDLTVAGTLSAGGLGGSSHRRGFAASHVLAAEVVLGSGELLRVGPRANRDVFDSVFGGTGRVGVISSVELGLEPVASSVETVLLRYDSPDRLIADQHKLSQNQAAFHASGMCCATIHGLIKNTAGTRIPLRRWSYTLELAFAREGDSLSGSVLDGLDFVELMHRESDEIGSFLSRFDSRFEMMRASGAWQQAHPWFEALVPVEAAEATLEAMMELPPFFGDGHRISMVADGDRPTAIAFPQAAAAMVVAVLPVGIPAAFVPAALKAIAGLDAHIYRIGGCRYLSGWLSRTGEFDWRQHYGDNYERLLSLKRMFDPSDVFRSKLPFD